MFSKNVWRTWTRRGIFLVTCCWSGKACALIIFPTLKRVKLRKIAGKMLAHNTRTCLICPVLEIQYDICHSSSACQMFEALRRWLFTSLNYSCRVRMKYKTSFMSKFNVQVLMEQLVNCGSKTKAGSTCLSWHCQDSRESLNVISRCVRFDGASRMSRRGGFHWI